MRRRSFFVLTAFVLAFSLAAIVAPAPAYAAACVSTGSGNWSDPATWTACGGVIPQAGDTVAVAATHVVTVDTDTAALAGLTVDGTVIFDETGTGRTMTVTGDLTVNSGGSFTVGVGGTATTHALILGGNLSNSGVLDASPAGATSTINTTFNGAADQAITGAGTPTTRFNKVTLDKGAPGVKVTCALQTSLRGGANTVTWTNGTWEQTANRVAFSSGAQTIGATGGLILSGTGRADFERDLTVNGVLTVNSTGTAPVLALGKGQHTLEVLSGAVATFTAGVANINGQLKLSGGTTTLDGAIINLDPQVDTNYLGAAKDTFFASKTANLAMSAGAVTLIDPINATGNGKDLRLQKPDDGYAHTFTGGEFVFGDAITTTLGADGFEVDTNGNDNLLWDVVINGPTASPEISRTVKLMSGLSLANDLTINSGGILNGNGKTLRLKGDWINDGTYTASGGSVAFNGSAAQQLGGLTVTTFGTLTLNNAAGVTLGNDATVDASLALTTGDLTTGANTLLMGAAATSSGPGDVVGHTKRTSFATGTPYSFGNGDVSVNFVSAATLPSEMTVTLVKTQPAGFPYAVNRTYSIDAVGADGFNATLRLRYQDSELNLFGGATEDGMSLFRFDGVDWVLEGRDGYDATANWAEKQNVTTFSDWTLAANTPTALTLREFRSATALPAASALLGLLALAAGLVAARRWLR